MSEREAKIAVRVRVIKWAVADDSGFVMAWAETEDKAMAIRDDLAGHPFEPLHVAALIITEAVKP